MISRQFFAIKIILLVFVFSLGSRDNKTIGQEYPEYLQRKPAVPTILKTTEIPVNLEQEREFQKAVEMGQQMWRLNPEEVACNYLRSLPEGANAKYCWGREENKITTSVTSVINSVRCRVQLKRLVKPDGIWTPVKLEVELK